MNNDIANNFFSFGSLKLAKTFQDNGLSSLIDSYESSEAWQSLMNVFGLDSLFSYLLGLGSGV